MKIYDIKGNVIYESKLDSLKEALEESVKNNVPLYEANLYCADLEGSNLLGVSLTCANLIGANLMYANLNHSMLIGAILRNANLNYAVLNGAILDSANLNHARLYNANLYGAVLNGADLSGIEYDYSTIGLSYSCPMEGSFIGYKKAGGFIVKLKIPEDALRSSATTRKCRASKAKVLEIQNIDGSPSDVKAVCPKFDKTFIYKVGKTVEVEDFDTDRWHECASGIHFFIDRNDAVRYDC